MKSYKLSKHHPLDIVTHPFLEWTDTKEMTNTKRKRIMHLSKALTCYTNLPFSVVVGAFSCLVDAIGIKRPLCWRGNEVKEEYIVVEEDIAVCDVAVEGGSEWWSSPWGRSREWNQHGWEVGTTSWRRSRERGDAHVVGAEWVGCTGRRKDREERGETQNFNQSRYG